MNNANQTNLPPEFDYFKTGNDVDQFIQKNPAFAVCLEMAVSPEIDLLENFLKVSKIKEEDLKLDRSIKSFASIDDRIVLNFFGFVYNSLFLRLSENEKTNMEDCLKIKGLCLEMCEQDIDQNYDFALKFKMNDELGVNTVLARKGINLSKLFSVFNKLLGKEVEYKVYEIVLFNEPIGENRYKTVSGAKIKNPQKFIDEYRI